MLQRLRGDFDPLSEQRLGELLEDFGFVLPSHGWPLGCQTWISFRCRLGMSPGGRACGVIWRGSVSSSSGRRASARGARRRYDLGSRRGVHSSATERLPCQGDGVVRRVDTRQDIPRS